MQIIVHSQKFVHTVKECKKKKIERKLKVKTNIQYTSVLSILQVTACTYAVFLTFLNLKRKKNTHMHYNFKSEREIIRTIRQIAFLHDYSKNVTLSPLQSANSKRD